MLTAPEARTALAAGGYGGLGKLTALPFNTPPDICLGIGRLPGATETGPA
jgi:hypothetical protein